MAAIQKTNFTSKDFPTFRDELLQKLPIISNGKYTDLNETDPGIALLELYMSMADNILFYQDMMSQELYLPTARQRRNVIRLLRLIGYEFTGYTASIGNVTIRIAPNAQPKFPVYIDAGAQFEANSTLANTKLVFTTTERGILYKMEDTVTLPVVQGYISEDSFLSDGTQNQKFTLTKQQIDKMTIKVSVNSPDITSYTPSSDTTQVWYPVESFYVSDGNSKAFRMEIDEFSRVSLIFGDGLFGQIPPYQQNINVQYIVTEGEIGNVGQNAIVSVSSGEQKIYDDALNAVSITVTNNSASSGGGNVESIEKAKQAGIGKLYSLNRALSRSDFKALLETLPDVTSAVAWGESEEVNPDFRLMNLVRVCFFAKQFADMYYNPASYAAYKSLKENIVTPYLLNKTPITTKVTFIDPIFVDIFLYIRIGVDPTLYDPTIVGDKVKYAITDYYSFDNVTLGQDIRISDILKVANTVEGVSWAVVKRLHDTPNESDPNITTEVPEDILLENWKLPVLTDTKPITLNTQSNVPSSGPYLVVKLPSTLNIGFKDIFVRNPDDQTDIGPNEFAYYPAENIKHIKVDYDTVSDGPTSQGGFYRNPSSTNDSFIFVSKS